MIPPTTITGWWFLATPLKHMKVSWDDDSQYFFSEKIKTHITYVHKTINQIYHAVFVGDIIYGDVNSESAAGFGDLAWDSLVLWKWSVFTLRGTPPPWGCDSKMNPKNK